MNPLIEATEIGTRVTFDAHALAKSRTKALDPALKNAFLASGRAADRLEQLFTGQAICITSGQQPGLLTGPLYSIYKALSAVALAETVEQALGRPVVPVFWVAGDDHDFAEGNHCNLLMSSNDISRIVLRERHRDAPMTPLYKEPVGDDIDAVLEAVVAAAPETEHLPEVLEWIGRHYRPESDLSSAFAGALAELLGRFGLVVFNPTHLHAKRAMAPWMLQTLEQATVIDRDLAARAAELESQGRPTPVNIGGGASPVMIEATLGRDRLIAESESFRTRRSAETKTLDELRAIAEQNPTLLSGNVLLRPVLEAALLPTVAYVGGPGELAYFPQTKPIYRALGVEPQVVVSRWSGRIVDRRTSKVLDKYELRSEDLGLPGGSVEANIVRDQLPETATSAMSRLRDAIEREYEVLVEVTEGIDPTLTKPVQSSARGSLRNLEGVEKRLISHLKKKNEVVVRQIETARKFLFPLGKPQERVANIVPFLVRYGDQFLDGVYDRCVEWANTLETSSSEA